MDDIEAAAEKQEALEAFNLAAVRHAAHNILQGHSGTCDKCGEDSVRLMGPVFFKQRRRPDVADDIIEGICPPCRDRLKLP